MAGINFPLDFNGYDRDCDGSRGVDEVILLSQVVSPPDMQRP